MTPGGVDIYVAVRRPGLPIAAVVKFSSMPLLADILVGAGVDQFCLSCWEDRGQVGRIVWRPEGTVRCDQCGHPRLVTVIAVVDLTGHTSKVSMFPEPDPTARGAAIGVLHDLGMFGCPRCSGDQTRSPVGALPVSTTVPFDLQGYQDELYPE